jgi:hypothetical protein
MLIAATPGVAMAANLVINGDFEAGNEDFASDYTYVAVASQDPGLGTMEPEQTYAVGTDPWLYHELWSRFWDHTKGDGTGLMMIVNGADQVAGQRVWYNDVPIAVAADTDYTFSFWGATSYPAAYATLKVYINEVQVGTYQAPSVVATWTKFSVAWNSGGATAASIKLICDTLVHTGTDFAIDDIMLRPSVTVTEVPGNPKLCVGGLRLEGDDLVSGTYYGPEGQEVTIVVYRDEDGQQLFDFSVTPGVVYKVVVKGGNAANIYDYTPDGVDSGTGLHAPANASGKYADLSHIDFCFGTPGGGPVPSLISGSKWYDQNADGVWDEGELGIEGWKINLFKLDGANYVEVADTYTDEDGYYEFADLDPGVYKVEEGAVSGGWRQTFPTDPKFYDEITLSNNVQVDDLNFGNVCEKTATGGYTLGYWSNKNGTGVLDANEGDWQSFLAGYNLVGKSGSDMDPTTAAFRTWLLKADATNMSYMLSVQMAATLLNGEFKDADYLGYGVIDMDGSWISIEALKAKANTFLGSNHITVEAGAARDEAEFYKNIFDGLNNNKLTLIHDGPCDLPVWE